MLKGTRVLVLGLWVHVLVLGSIIQRSYSIILQVAYVRALVLETCVLDSSTVAN